MPALLDDPTSPVIYRATGEGPYPSADNPQIPSSIFPRPVTLRDRVTIATLVPFFSPSQVPKRLIAYLCENLNKEIEGGDTYPMINPLPLETFGPYWFGNFGAVMVLGDIGGIEAVDEMERNGTDWSKVCLGSFYVKPNYPGRSSHVCNGGFLVTPAARNKGVGKSMGQCYLDWAPQLGYSYSVFNLVYESNTASCRIWDSLGFKRIGRVPACGNLKSFDEPVDAIIYGRDLKSEGNNVVSEERFDKIRYYLRHSLYPQGADRSEKSRLRSAATHYKLIGGEDGVPEKLMLKGKEVVSDPQTQYEVARRIHLLSHGGINKTTASIATKYHWVRIKETVSHVIKNCPECKDSNKPAIVRTEVTRDIRRKINDNSEQSPEAQQLLQSQIDQNTISLGQQRLTVYNSNAQVVSTPDRTSIQDPETEMADYDDMAIDPQIMEQIQAQLVSEYQHHQDTYAHPGLPDFAGTSQLQHHHNHSNDFDNDQTDSFMSGQNPAVMDHRHVMDSSPPSRRLRPTRLSQQLLQTNYVGVGGGSGFGQ